MSNRKNIVFRTGSLGIGGTERILVNLIKHLNHGKYNISLIIDNDLCEENIFKNEIPYYIKIYFLRPYNLVKKFHYFNSIKRNFYQKFMYNYYMTKRRLITKKNMLISLEKIIEKYGDIDVFIDFNNGATRRFIDEVNAKKKIIWMHNSLTMFSEIDLKKFEKKISKYDIIVSICEEMEKEIIYHFPNMKDKIIRIYNPIYIDEIKEMSYNSEGLSAEEIKLMTKKYILMVSRIDIGQKDFGTLINGYKLAKEKGFSYKLYLIGSGEGKPRVQKMIDNENLQDHILMLGSKKNPFIWMKNAEFFILSSKEEGFPTVLIEAMALKNAIIASKCKTGPTEILCDGECGILFDVGDYNTLSIEMLRLYTDKKYKEELEIKSLNRIDEFSLEKSIIEIEKLLNI
ncbi:MAG: glycosyltransferase [Fusobacteriaceae bacterium]|jgi:glycosyltransferase involved in cell wall biosynthesis|nr:glycosyltransferase [Fusobacteriaceae bacterium]